ncbi:DsbA family protein [Acidisphaera sp. L21]|uniref:DsbA family protein n=1 Tax=Acidisphaera sp. L21 TaxID=1641851 RepID=UPI00131DD8F3|nr:DsbA family protein [Acidisphaera sp. L21]
MLLSRRVLIATSAAIAVVPGLARAADADPRMSDRILGKADAPVTMQEWFSLTCTHCAAWGKEVFPEVKAKLIDTGKLRYIYRDFPLDQVALTAAMVARALPPERYEAFVSTLLASQDRWAFARDINPTDEIFKRAALAGMPRALFDTTVADQPLKTAILAEQQGGADKYKVDSTPTFIINEKAYSGEQPYEAIAKYVAAAS